MSKPRLDATVPVERVERPQICPEQRRIQVCISRSRHRAIDLTMLHPFGSNVPANHVTEELKDVQSAIHPSTTEMKHVFALCRSDRWREVLRCLRAEPRIALTPMVMANHISSTVLHQAITSRGDICAREEVIRHILCVSPQAASIRNGYGSLPLHVIAQRNTKMAARVKEHLIELLVDVHPAALLEPGGVGRRTPLHIIFTDYVSPHLTQILIHRGAAACSMKDKKGWLPAHVAASRHCSPEKLRMLLDVYPQALFDETDEGYTLLSLAKSTATASHPNFVLIDMLVREMNLVSRSLGNAGRIVCTTPTATIPAAVGIEVSPSPSSVGISHSPDSPSHHPIRCARSSSECGHDGPIGTPPLEGHLARAQQVASMPAPCAPSQAAGQTRRQGCDDRAVGLLLHFSQSRKGGDEADSPRRFASVKHVEV